MTTAAVKLSYADETRRVALGEQPLSFEALGALVAATFPQAPRSVALVYRDDEGDVVTVASARELAEAQRLFALVLGKTLHVRVMPRVGVREQLPPAVLHAVDELSSSLARLATGTRESFAHGGGVFLERGRASVAYSAKQTKELFECARKEISQRLRDVHARLAGEIGRRRSSAASDTLATAEDEGVEMETRSSEHFLPHATDASRDGDDNVDDDEGDDSDDESIAQAPEVRAAAEEAAEHRDAVEPEAALPRDDQQQQQQERAPAPEEEMSYESDAETVACSSSDEDDDDDDDGENSDAEWAVVPDVWNAEVALARTILPQVHVEDCVAMLRKHGGNLEAAINELTDA